MSAGLTFTEPEIQRLFGHEAAEDETLSRLREYYFKTTTYEQVVTDLPLRILVGHKGIGKSALFQVAMAEDKDAGRIAVLIKPDDVASLATDVSEFLTTVRAWKDGLLEIVSKKVLDSIGTYDLDIREGIKKLGGQTISFIQDTVRNTKYLNLTPAKRRLRDSFLANKPISIYIDDLDRGWQGKRTDVHRISALLNAVRDLISDNPLMRFRISLRSDVYYLVRTSDESTDKIEGSVIWQSWTNHEIFVLLLMRVETFFGNPVDIERWTALRQWQLAPILNRVMEMRFRGTGHWENAPTHRVLMSLIRKRPRDLVKLCSLAARNARAHNATIIETEHFEAIFEEYSQGRIQDTINEFRSELPAIEQLLLNMKPNKKERTASIGYTYTTDALLKKIRKVMEMASFKTATGSTPTAKELAAFMYKINFLTARKEDGGWITRKYFEESRYLSSTLADFGFDWEVHPAYRWALQPSDIGAIYSSIQLTNND